MASVEAAVSVVARPGLLGRSWHWRYELGLIIGVASARAGIGITLGPGWLLVTAAAVMGAGGAAMAWPVSRRRLIARAWCVITPHRVRTGCAHAWVQTRDGRLPVVLYTVPAEFGERVSLWCRAGIVAADLEAARDILRAACWASDVRVVADDRRSHRVVLEGDPPPSRRPARREHTEPGLAVPGPRITGPAGSGRRRRPRGALLVLGLGGHGPFG